MHYRAHKYQKPFLDAVPERFDKEIKAVEEEHDIVAASHHEQVRKVESMIAAQPTPLLDFQREKLEFEVKCLYPLLEKTEQLLDRIQQMKPFYMRSGNEAHITKYHAEVDRESGEVVALKQRILKLEEQLRVTDEAMKSAIDEEKRIGGLKQEQWTRVQDLRACRKRYSERSGYALCRTPSMFIEK